VSKDIAGSDIKSWKLDNGHMRLSCRWSNVTRKILTKWI